MQSKFARDMMAQKLMSENKDNPFNSRFFQPSDAMAAPTRQGFSNLLSRMEQKDKQGTNVFPALAMGSGFAPSAGISDVLGFAPDPFNPGQTLPSFSENIDQGRFLDAGLQTIGAGGDVMLAAAPFAPVLLAPAAAMKATSQIGKALRGGSKATKAVDDVKPGDIAKVVPPTDKSDGIFAFHGSGADFDEFKLSKIGTGEGNQAFGYGLYFTDSKDIAKFYKDALSDSMAETRFVFDGTTYERGSPEWKMLSLIKNKSIASAKSLFKILESDLADGKPYITAEQIKRYKNILDQAPKKSDIKKEQGRIYDVKINAVMDDLIDYDKSLRQQNDKVKKILKPYYEYYMVAETADFGTLLESAYRHLPQDEFSERLAKEGIKGIKYQSGQLSGITDSKATNFVIFDDKIIDIMAKYGIVGAISVSAMQRGSGTSESDILPPDQT